MKGTRRPQSRGVLGWGLLVFACLQVGLVAAMEHWRPEFRDPEYAVKLHCLRQRLAEQPGRPLLLIIGSSRPAVGFRPSMLPPNVGAPEREPLVFNFGLLSSGPILELLCLQRLLDDGIRPDFVLIECWPLIWDQHGKRVETAQLDAARLGLVDLPRLWPYAASQERLLREWGLVHLVPWLANRFAILNRLAPTWAGANSLQHAPWEMIDGEGWFPWLCPDDPAVRRRLTDRAREKFACSLQDFHHDPHADRALRELLDLCRRRHIPAALFFMPESREFQSWYAPAVREYVAAYLEQLSREYDVPLLDARDWVPDDDFVDGSHLVPRGADLFTERFGREALPVLLPRLRRCAE
jgi:hypothetical protein